MDLRKLGQVLRERREALGIPAAVLARRAGIGRTTLWTVERGENPTTGKPSRPRKDILERWVAALRLDPDEQAEVLQLAGYLSAVTPATAPAHQPPFARGAFPFPQPTQTEEEEVEALITQMRALLRSVPPKQRAEYIEFIRSFFDWLEFRKKRTADGEQRE